MSQFLRSINKLFLIYKLYNYLMDHHQLSISKYKLPIFIKIKNSLFLFIKCYFREKKIVPI
jgi:hypothetical protein